ncbi:MAG: class I SAM-dependent methyltransferase [Thermoguttaceae bacterium]
MSQHVCPWWGAWFIDNPLRRWLHQPEVLLAPFVSPGMTVLDFGCGMGFTSIALARLVGDRGTVIAADLQPQMLQAVRKRARRAGLGGRVLTHRCAPDSLELERTFHFALAFWSAHEVPDLARLVGQMHAGLEPGGKFLVIEPRGHVTDRDMETMTATAHRAGFHVLTCAPAVRWSHAVVYGKP